MNAVGVEVITVGAITVVTTGAVLTVEVVTTGMVAVLVVPRFTANTPDPTCTNWSGGVKPPPLTGVDATTVGAHVLASVLWGMINGALAGPTVVKAGITATTLPP